MDCGVNITPVTSSLQSLNLITISRFKYASGVSSAVVGFQDSKLTITQPSTLFPKMWISIQPICHLMQCLREVVEIEAPKVEALHKAFWGLF